MTSGPAVPSMGAAPGGLVSTADEPSAAPPLVACDTLDLAGTGWELREALGETWRWYVDSPLIARAGNNVDSAAAAAATTPGWLPSRVPSSVRGDLLRAGEIPSPFVGRDSRLSEWVSTRSWVYRRTVTVRPLTPGEQIVLETDGVDPSALVFVDGHEVGALRGPFRRERLNLTAWLHDGGTHQLTIVLPPAPDSQPQVGRTELVSVHAPRMTYGWDFCPRMVHQGIWSGLRLVLGHVQAAHVRVTTDIVDGHGHVALVGVLEAEPGTRTGVRAVLRDGAREVGALDREATADTSGKIAIDDRVTIEDPALWWPHGYGERARYTVSIEANRLGRAPAEARAVWSRPVGFRRAELVPTPGSPEGALPYGLRVNGTDIRLVGWNWAPADALFGEIAPARLRHLLTLARSSGAQLIRVWGGGLIETDAFYDLCDELGLLVWQELSQSSSGMQSAPASDPDFLALLRAETHSAITARGHHPSLVLWGGGNELDLDGVPLDEERSPALAAVGDVVRSLAPRTGWLPTSPTGPQFHNRLDVIAADPTGLHDVHGPWEHQGLVGQHTLANAGTCLAHTEFGVEGMANRRTLDALVPDGQLLPLDRSNPVHRHLGDWWNNADLVDEMFGGRLGQLDEDLRAEGFRRASQLLQATGLAAAVEADLRRAPRCSMVLPWQLAESFPNTWCTAVVDHRGDVKPAFHAVARAFDRDRVTLRVDRSVWGGQAVAQAEAWLWSEAGQPAGSRVEMTLSTMAGEVLGRSATVVTDRVGAPRAVARLALPVAEASGAVVWRARWVAPDGFVVDDERQVATFGEDWSSLLDLRYADLVVELSAHDDLWTITVEHRSGPAVLGLELLDARPYADPGWSVLAGDPRPLLPGESRTFTATWHGDRDGGARALTLESWNTVPVRLIEAPGQPGAHVVPPHIATTTI